MPENPTSEHRTMSVVNLHQNTRGRIYGHIVYQLGQQGSTLVQTEISLCMCHTQGWSPMYGD